MTNPPQFGAVELLSKSISCQLSVTWTCHTLPAAHIDAKGSAITVSLTWNLLTPLSFLEGNSQVQQILYLPGRLAHQRRITGLQMNKIYSQLARALTLRQILFLSELHWNRKIWKKASHFFVLRDHWEPLLPFGDMGVSVVCLKFSTKAQDKVWMH